MLNAFTHDYIKMAKKYTKKWLVLISPLKPLYIHIVHSPERRPAPILPLLYFYYAIQIFLRANIESV